MSRDRRLIDKGADAPFQALVDQVRYHVKLGKLHADRLKLHNWTLERTTALSADLDALDTEEARKIAERAAAKATTRDEGAALSDAKALVSSMRNVAPQVVRNNPAAGVTLDDLEAGTKLGRSTGKMSKYLGKIGPHVVKLDDAFAPFFQGQKLSEQLAAKKAGLDDASSTQAVDHSTLPDDTASVLELKGKVLEAVEDMNAVGRNAFANDTELRAAFNKDILTKARKTRPKKEDKTA